MKHIVEKGWNQMIFKHIVDGVNLSKGKTYEQVPSEDLWEDGELDEMSVHEKVLHNVFYTGEYILVREVQDDNEHRNS